MCFKIINNYFILARGDYGMEGLPGLEGLIGEKVSTLLKLYIMSN